MIAVSVPTWTIEEAVDLWLAYCAEGKKSTAQAYRTDCERRFLPFCRREGLVYLHDLLRSGVASRYAAFLDEQRHGGQPLSANTRQRSKACVKSFARWCVAERLLPYNFAVALTLPKAHRVPQKAPAIISVETYDALEAAIDLESPWGLRDRAMLALSYATGCRSHEARLMRVHHVEPEHQRVWLRDLKTGRWKPVPVEAWVIERIQAWIDARGLDVEDFLWPSRQAACISRKGWWEALKRIFRQAGKPYLCPHDFRHTIREDAKAAGAPIESVAALTGTSIFTLSQHYGVRNRPADPREAAGAIHEFRAWQRLKAQRIAAPTIAS